jgi:hypothetical protein
MKQKLGLLVVFLLLIAVLAGLNAVSHQQKEKTPDSEFSPNRSSFNSGPTGTQAWYSLLNETGRRAVRWQEPAAALLTAREAPNVFVLIGGARREFTDEDATSLLRWVADGGRLVLVDRAPPEQLTVTTSRWNVGLEEPQIPAILSVDPSDQKLMTADTAVVRPAQPSVFTQGINAIQPSRFAASIRMHRYADDRGSADETITAGSEERMNVAPVIHFPLRDDGLVADAPFGNGSIVFVADPYIVSNGGIGIADNAQLAVNLVNMKDALIAFDEYHQGYGTDNNRFLQFFADTPVIAIFLQGLFLAGLVLYSRSRRFARPVPEAEPDRLSKLEYVSAMAELQRRTRAYDLAMEDIYAPARIAICRTLGLDPMAANTNNIASLAAERIGGDAQAIGSTLFKCEEIMRGEPTTKAECVRLIAELRELQRKMGIHRSRSADVR